MVAAAVLGPKVLLLVGVHYYLLRSNTGTHASFIFFTIIKHFFLRRRLLTALVNKRDVLFYRVSFFLTFFREYLDKRD